jgi:general secretion pathway protein K
MKSSDPRRGVVLVTVLWSIALLAALAMAASVTFRSYAGVMGVDRHRVQRDALLTAGLEASAGVIQTAGNTPIRDIEITVALGTGSVRSRLNDEGGRIDLAKAPLEVLASLLRSVGAPPAAAAGMAQSIVERRGPTNAGRANAERRSAAVATTHEQALAEVGRTPGMRAQWLLAMAPLTTVYGSETVNPLTAPRGVIAALPGIDGTRLETFLAERQSTPTDAERLVRVLAPAQRYLAVRPQRVAAVELITSLTEGQVAAARAVIVVLPQDSEPYRVMTFTPLRAAGAY